jgi:uncharacterized membrane protein
MFKVILFFHILTGAAGLTLGPIAMLSRKRRGVHTTAGKIYHWNMLLVCISACALGILHWKTSSWLIPIAGFSFWNSLRGFRAAKLKYPGWISDHISGMGGSYIALVTALIVVNDYQILGQNNGLQIIPWIVPTLVGSYFIRKMQLRLARR